jgi:predicted transporter
MKKALAFTLLGILVLFGLSLAAGLHVFQPWDRSLVDQPGDPPLAPGEMSWNTYKKAKLALGSFDLVNGLTKHDLETINTYNSLGFHYLMGCLWLVLGFRLVNRWTNHKDKTGGLRR